MRSHVLLCGLLIFSGAALADTPLSIHAQIKQPKSATCNFSAFYGFGTFLALAHGDAVVGENFNDKHPSTATPTKGDGCTAVFTSGGSDSWSLKQILGTSGPIAVSGDRMIVGLTLYTYDGSAWQEGPTLQIPGLPNTNQFDAQNFMSSVALDGDTVMVGVEGTTEAGQGIAGSIYVYTLDASGVPSVPTKITADVPVIADRFGHDISLLGGVLAVRSEASVYVFEHQVSGQWRQMAQFDGDTCGCGASFIADFSTVAVMDSKDIGFITAQSTVQLIQRTGAGVWLKNLKLIPRSGEQTVLAAGAGRLAIGSPNKASSNPAGGDGSVDLFGISGGVSVQGDVDNPNGTLWFGAPLALDASRMLVSESNCQDGVPCTPMTVDVVEAGAATSGGSGTGGDTSSGGSGGSSLGGIALLAGLVLLRRRG